MSDIKLTGSASLISLTNNYTLHAPGIHGNIVNVKDKGATTRSATSSPKINGVGKAMEEWIKAEKMLFNEFEFAIAKDEYQNADAETTRSAGVTRSTPEGEKAMVLTTPKIRDNMASVILHIDENSGEQRWIFPDAETDTKDAFTFLLPRGGEELSAEEAITRGAITAGIRKVVKVFAWLIDPIVEAGVHSLVAKWEQKKRPYSLTMAGKNTPGNTIDWQTLDGKPTLLLLHGTFSTWEAAFYGLLNSAKYYEELDKYYEGRIIAFNHPSLHASPADNIKHFLTQIPDGISLSLDVLTHSRGGLVGRELCERLDDLNTYDKKVVVNKAVFVAAPHRGTILTDKANWRKLINTYTNLLVGAPDGILTILSEAILTLIKVVGGNALSGLPGLDAMLPGGDYLKRLNSTEKSNTTYYAIGADYTPQSTEFANKLILLGVSKLVEKLFGEKTDLVVPTAGCFATGADNGGFPIPKDRQKCYDFDANVHHVNFFDDDNVNKQIYQWLKE